MDNNVKLKVEELKQRGFHLSVGDVFNKSWKTFSGIAGYAILAFVLYYVITGVLNYLIGFIFPNSVLDYEELINALQDGDNEYVLQIFTEYGENSSTLFSMITWIINFAFYPIYFSIYTMAYKYDKGETVQFSDIFIHYTNGKFVPIFLTSVVVYILTVLGTVFCIIPGFFVHAILMLAVPFVLFANANVSEAIKESINVSFKNFGSFSVVLLMIFGILITGLLMCCVGLIGAVPLMFVIHYTLYKEVIGFDDNQNEIDQIGTDIYKDNPYM